MGTGPAVTVATPDSGAARVGATAALGAVVSFLGLFAGRPDAVFHVPGAVGAEADRAACVTSYYEANPDLSGEIVKIVNQDVSKKTVLEDFLGHLSSYADLKVIAVHDADSGAEPSHEAALHQAKALNVGTLLELEQLSINFDFDYAGKDCEMRSAVALQYRFIGVDGDRQLMSGHIRQDVFFSEPIHSSTLTRWLEDNRAFAKLIEIGFSDAITQVWYANVPSQ